MAQFPLIIVLLLFGWSVYVCASSIVLSIGRSRFARAHRCVPPSQRATDGDPIIGLSFALEVIRRAKKSQYMEITRERFTRFGNTYVNERLLYTTVNTIDPENYREVLVTRFQDFETAPIRVAAMRPLFGEGIFATDGPRWAHSRSMLRPILSRQHLSPLLPMLERHFQQFLQVLPPDDEAVDLLPLFKSFTVDTAMEFLTGRSTDTLVKASGPRKEFVDSYIACCLEVVKVFQLGPLYKFKRQRIAEHRERVWRYIDEYVDEALDLRRQEKDLNETTHKGDEEYNFLRELARDTDDRNVLRSQILNTLLASSDTTAALLGNLVFELSRNTSAYAKLREEMLLHVGSDRLPTEADFRSMPWLRHCINEALRLYPSVPNNTKQARCDLVLPVGGGLDGRAPLFVAKGTNVLMNLYSMHRREDFFGTTPTKFMPERWESIRPPPYAYLPFTAGPRVCLGQQFAITEVSYIVTRMVQSLAEIKSIDSRPWIELYTIALWPKNGTKVALTRASM